MKNMQHSDIQLEEGFNTMCNTEAVLSRPQRAC